MIPDLRKKLEVYVDGFNSDDEEIHPQAVTNEYACDYLAKQIPLLDCPDETIERTYYYRWWTLRKQWKETPAGHILTEFLPDVKWAGIYNSINCAVSHHLREGRWLKDPDGWMKEYIMFWLNRIGNAFSYSMWFVSSFEEYLKLHPDEAFAEECFDKLVELFRDWEKKSLHSCGLYWSDDDRDGMEYSISGPGIRPTLNSYMYGDACAIARIAAKAGKMEIAAEFSEKAEAIREKMNRLLWDQDFYRTIPCEKDADIPKEARPVVEEAHKARELIGYLPWYFHMPDPGKSDAFRELTNDKGFAAPFGLTTAEQRHPRFMFEHEHECLWNGPVWPFATSQTLTAVANHLRDHGEAGITKADYYRLLRQYAESHRLTDENGVSHLWIDEDMDPYTGEWIARKQLMEDHWNPERGGYERGKDYNHSTFCDLVLSGLLGIEMKNGVPVAEPLIPDDWDYFCVSGITEDNWTIVYDRTGKHYGEGSGLRIYRL